MTKANAIYLYQVVECEQNAKIYADHEETTYSDIVHKTYKNAIDELYSKGYRFKSTDDEHTEWFYKERIEERNNKIMAREPVSEAYIKRLSLFKEELEA